MKSCMLTQNCTETTNVPKLDECCHKQPVSVIFGFNEFLEYQKSSCDLKLHCPNECANHEVQGANQCAFKSIEALQHHLEFECPRTSFRCLNCECKMERQHIHERHDESACLGNLTKAFNEVNDENMILLKTELDLDHEYDNLETKLDFLESSQIL